MPGQWGRGEMTASASKRRSNMPERKVLWFKGVNHPRHHRSIHLALIQHRMVKRDCDGNCLFPRPGRAPDLLFLRPPHKVPRFPLSSSC